MHIHLEFGITRKWDAPTRLALDGLCDRSTLKSLTGCMGLAWICNSYRPSLLFSSSSYVSSKVTFLWAATVTEVLNSSRVLPTELQRGAMWIFLRLSTTNILKVIVQGKPWRDWCTWWSLHFDPETQLQSIAAALFPSLSQCHRTPDHL